MDIKTNAIRTLDKNKIPYELKFYDNSKAYSGIEVANMLNEDPKIVYKTLVTISKSKKNYVFVIPVEKELDLKKCAKVVNEKSIDMLEFKNLLSTTGYVHGGCSPIGMKKTFVTIIDISAKNLDKIIFSGGKIGIQIIMSPKDLEKVVKLAYEDLTK